MNLLVVDDQASVVEGITNGIDWAADGFDHVYCAYNAIEARQYLTMYSIDVMLCDIEMPYESGLSLLEWIQEQKLSVKSIILTAHAEFSYAQQALKLGSIDYVLQPASFSDIEKAVSKAIHEIKQEHIMTTLMDMEQNVMDHRSNISRAMFFSFLQGKSTDYDFLRYLGLFPGEGAPFWLVVFQTIGWKKEAWDEKQMLFAFDNICEELLGPYRQKFLLTLSDPSSCAAIIWSGEELIAQNLLVRQMQFLYSVVDQFRAFEIAIYVRRGETTEDLPKIWESLTDMQKNNVTLSPGLFFDAPSREENASGWSGVYKKQWQEQLTAGAYETTRFEAIRFIDNSVREGTMNAQNLKRFYTEFLNVAFAAAGTEVDLLEKILITPQDFDLYYNGYESVESMKKLVNHIIDALKKDGGGNGTAQEDALEKAKRYIREHIRDELRREDVAEAVHLNPDYLSKMFRKACGVPLKEYIIQQKMEHAQMLLKTTTMPIGVIAGMVGYDNFSYFSQTYKRVIGERPMDTRGGEA